eukprot:COSAG01_NODE_8039_length_2945_cov_13.651441_1_plen_459_part_00
MAEEPPPIVDVPEGGAEDGGVILEAEGDDSGPSVQADRCFEWLGELSAAGYSIEMGPEKFLKSKAAKKLLGRVKAEHRYVVLASRAEAQSFPVQLPKKALFYHCGKPGVKLHMDKQSVPIEADTVTTISDGTFTVAVPAGSEHMKAGTSVKFQYEGDDDDSAGKVGAWVKTIEDVRYFASSGVPEAWRTKLLERDCTVSADGCWALTNDTVELEEDWDGIADIVTAGLFRVANWEDLESEWDSFSGEVDDKNAVRKAATEAQNRIAGLDGLLDSIGMQPASGSHGGNDEAFVRHMCLHHYVQRSNGQITDTGELAFLQEKDQGRELMLTLGSRADHDVVEIARRLLLIKQNPAPESAEERAAFVAKCKGETTVAREVEVEPIQYMALKPGIIRETADTKSKKVGNIEEGRLIISLEEQGNRVRFTCGWISRVSSKGTPLLEQMTGDLSLCPTTHGVAA